MTYYYLTSFTERMPFVVKNMGQWITENSLAQNSSLIPRSEWDRIVDAQGTKNRCDPFLLLVSWRHLKIAREFIAGG
jgi:hypothetical protein